MGGFTHFFHPGMEIGRGSQNPPGGDDLRIAVQCLGGERAADSETGVRGEGKPASGGAQQGRAKGQLKRSDLWL